MSEVKRYNMFVTNIRLKFACLSPTDTEIYDEFYFAWERKWCYWITIDFIFSVHLTSTKHGFSTNCMHTKLPETYILLLRRTLYESPYHLQLTKFAGVAGVPPSQWIKHQVLRPSINYTILNNLHLNEIICRCAGATLNRQPSNLRYMVTALWRCPFSSQLISRVT